MLTTTENNLKNLIILTNKCSIDEIEINDVDKLCYCPLSEDQSWKMEAAKLMIEGREQGTLDDEELEWLELLCTD